MQFKFKVNSFRKLHKAENGRQICVFTGPITNIPVEWEDWREVNVRDTNVRGDVYNAIIDTLKNYPGEMIFRNLGITILSPKVEFNNKTNTVTVEFLEQDKHGIANGGHTFSAIQEVIREGYVNTESIGESMPVVKVECVIGDLNSDELVDIVDGRNRSRAAQTHSLENLRESYKPIEKALSKQYYSDRISYSEFETNDKGKRKDISIREILSYIYCLDGSFSKNMHPIKAYSAKAAVVDFYASRDDKENERKDILVKASNIITEILELRDIIYRDLPQAYNDIGGKFGGLDTMGITTCENLKPLRFIKDDVRFNYPDAFVYPILAAFRKYVDHRGDWSWKEDPIQIWEEKKHEIASAIKDAVNFSQNANRLGKAGATWRMCYDSI